MYLFEDVLFPEEFLALPVGLGHRDVHGVNPAVIQTRHEVDEVREELGHKPGNRNTNLISHYRTSHNEQARI